MFDLAIIDSPARARLEYLVRTRHFWAEVNRVKESEDSQVFDLTVPNGHSYVGGGFVNHNTGKSTLARAIAKELSKNVVIVEHDAINQMSGSAHKIIGLLRPGVLVLNDIDRGGREDNMSLLQALEREYRNHPLLTCLTVNDIEQLDPAILRPGRTHETREVPEPTAGSREMILKYYIKKFDIQMTEEDVNAFMEATDGFSPADTREFCETALAVGVEVALQEIERINKQRALYAGDKCSDYNKAKRGPSEVKLR